MTDTGGEAVVDDVVVTGQRRRNPSEPFPERPGAVESPTGDTDVRDPLDGSEPDPCSDPASRAAWNADAAAAATARGLVQTAASLNDGSNLGNREFGANLYLAFDGSVQPTSVDIGNPAVNGLVPNVVIQPDGTDASNWMGDIHNHPSGDGRLSDDEWNNHINRVSAFMANQRTRTELAFASAYGLFSTQPQAPATASTPTQFSRRTVNSEKR